MQANSFKAAAFHPRLKERGFHGAKFVTDFDTNGGTTVSNVQTFTTKGKLDK